MIHVHASRCKRSFQAISTLVFVAHSIASKGQISHRGFSCAAFVGHQRRHAYTFGRMASSPTTAAAAEGSKELEINHDQQQLNFIDIGANMMDPMFRGIYRGKERHTSDLEDVMERAWANGLKKIVITAGTLEESKAALEMARSHPNLYCTVGVHPTRCTEFGDDPVEHIAKLREIVQDGLRDNKVVALGELGLDYARTEFCDIETQKRGLLAQLDLAKETKLPLFVHNRDTGSDLYDILCQRSDSFTKAVIHSFDDTLELANKFLSINETLAEKDIYIGLNGCSLRTADNLEVVKELPLNRLLLETDCPWCDIRQTHAGSSYLKTKFPTKQEKKWEPGHCVKSRAEPCHMIQVAEVVAGAKTCSVKYVAEACYENSLQFYNFKTS
jgi:TatD DNase family protein